MRYNEGWLASLSSEQHARGNATDYTAHGSQYIPILFRRMRADTENVKVSGPRPNGPILTLMFLAVNEAAEGKKLPDPGEDYLAAVEGKEGGDSDSGRLWPVFSLVIAAIGISLLGMA